MHGWLTSTLLVSSLRRNTINQSVRDLEEEEEEEDTMYQPKQGPKQRPKKG